MDAELRLLPPRTRELAQRIGLPALRKLSKWRGGVTIYVPSRDRLSRSHPLVRKIGWEAACNLADEEGRKLEVPFANQAAVAAFREQVRAYRREHSSSETALKFQISERWVRRLMEDQPKDTRQSDLFR